MLPSCTPESMKQPEMQEKFKTGPIGVIFLRRPGVMNMGAFLGQWFGFCLLVSFLCALLAVHVFGVGPDPHRVFHVVGLAAIMAYALGVVPDAIWWGHPWRSAFKHIIDGVIYGLVTAATFTWLWPH